MLRRKWELRLIEPQSGRAREAVVAVLLRLSPRHPAGAVA